MQRLRPWGRVLGVVLGFAALALAGTSVVLLAGGWGGASEVCVRRPGQSCDTVGTDVGSVLFGLALAALTGAAAYLLVRWGRPAPPAGAIPVASLAETLSQVRVAADSTWLCLPVPAGTWEPTTPACLRRESDPRESPPGLLMTLPVAEVKPLLRRLDRIAPGSRPAVVVEVLRVYEDESEQPTVEDRAWSLAAAVRAGRVVLDEAGVALRVLDPDLAPAAARQAVGDAMAASR